jgi:hypothetical protein
MTLFKNYIKYVTLFIYKKLFIMIKDAFISHLQAKRKFILISIEFILNNILFFS